MEQIDGLLPLMRFSIGKAATFCEPIKDQGILEESVDLEVSFNGVDMQPQELTRREK